ncbi:hypothetical protein FJZ41_00955 [Candidatus Shapirobacteria bacterium]|nr:hypothetical protein [Candidatus Shapirobacteria bacterium]
MINWFKRLKINKRQKFILTAVILAAGLLLIQLTGLSWRFLAIGVLAVFTYFLSAWSLSEGLNGIEWLTVLSLPSFFTIGVGLFYFLTPNLWLARLPLILLYGVGLYSLLLTENIFSVAAIRTIQLLRSAHAVAFLLTLVTSFFLYNVILSLREGPWFNLLLIFAVSFPLFLQGLWGVNLEEKLTKEIWLYSLGLAFVLGEISLAFSFWPVTVAVGSLSLTTSLYIVLGLAQHHLSERLFRRTLNEYLGVGIAVLIVIFLTTHWGG